MSTATIILGENATVLREQIAPRSVDMLYVDPPFGTGQVWTGKAGSFDDRWKWSAATDASVQRLAASNCEGMLDLLRATNIGRHDLAYLLAMAELLLAAQGSLKLTGTLWLHCDPTWGAYLKLIGSLLFLDRGEIVWKRSHSHVTKNAFGQIHDNIFVFGRSRAADIRLARVRLATRRNDPEIEVGGDPLLSPVIVSGLILNEMLNQAAAERADYPTQKPVALLHRLLAVATLPGDLVLDPCCGSGTTVIAAIKSGRRAIGIDKSADAVRLTERRVDAETRQGDLFGRAA